MGMGSDSLLPSSKLLQDASQNREIISRLPDDVLLRILSFLSTKEAIRFCTLSRRWKRLWTLLCNFVFESNSSSSSDENIEKLNLWKSFCLLIDRVLFTRHGLHLQKFRLLFSLDVDACRLYAWVLAMIEHKVQELDLIIPERNDFLLPDELFTSESLSKLNLRCYELKRLHSIRLSSLTKLKLRRVTFHDEATAEQLFSACPVLQELTLDGCIWNYVKRVNIVVPTLQKFTFERPVFSPAHDLNNCEIKVYAEYLVSFYLSSYGMIKLLPCNLSSLAYAYVDTGYSCSVDQERFQFVSDLLGGICSVKSLVLSRCTLEMYFSGSPQIRLPRFDNLTFLKVETGHYTSICLAGFMFLLHACPNLESLEIDAAVARRINWTSDIMPHCIKSCLKTVSLSCFKGTIAEVEFLKRLFENAMFLAAVKLFCVKVSLTSMDEESIRAQLRQVYKGLTQCMVEFHHLSSPPSYFTLMATTLGSVV